MKTEKKKRKRNTGCIWKHRPEGSVQEAPPGSCCGDCLGKIRGLKVEEDATLDEAFTNSPESCAAYHGRAEKKTQGESGVSSAENIRSLKVLDGCTWGGGKRLKQAGRQHRRLRGSNSGLLKGNGAKRGTFRTRFSCEGYPVQLLAD